MWIGTIILFEKWYTENSKIRIFSLTYIHDVIQISVLIYSFKIKTNFNYFSFLFSNLFIQPYFFDFISSIRSSIFDLFDLAFSIIFFRSYFSISFFDLNYTFLCGSRRVKVSAKCLSTNVSVESKHLQKWDMTYGQTDIKTHRHTGKDKRT